MQQFINIFVNWHFMAYCQPNNYGVFNYKKFKDKSYLAILLKYSLVSESVQ